MISVFDKNENISNNNRNQQSNSKLKISNNILQLREKIKTNRREVLKIPQDLFMTKGFIQTLKRETFSSNKSIVNINKYSSLSKMLKK